MGTICAGCDKVAMYTVRGYCEEYVSHTWYDIDMSKRIRRYYVRADGYNGDRATVGLAYDAASGFAIEMAPCGCYRANGRRYASEAEMLYYFDNHQRVHFPQVMTIEQV